MLDVRPFTSDGIVMHEVELISRFDVVQLSDLIIATNLQAIPNGHRACAAVRLIPAAIFGFNVIVSDYVAGNFLPVTGGAAAAGAAAVGRGHHCD